MDTTPKELFNKNIDFAIAEQYFPGCSMAWDLGGGDEWSTKNSRHSLTMGVIAGTLNTCVTQDVWCNFDDVSHKRWRPYYHWAFYDAEARTWTFL